jgi:hypothetical protein
VDKIEGDSNDSENGHMIGNGSYSVKIKLDTDLQQFFPIFGKSIAFITIKLSRNAQTALVPMQENVAIKNKSLESNM